MIRNIARWYYGLHRYWQIFLMALAVVLVMGLAVGLILATIGAVGAGMSVISVGLVVIDSLIVIAVVSGLIYLLGF